MSTPALPDTARPAYWHKKVSRLAFPIILSNVSVPLVGAVDTAVMGHLNEVELIGAVALGASIFSLVFWTFGFLRMGTSGIVAQAFGAKDHTTITLTLLRSLLIAFGLGVLVIVLQKPLLHLCFSLIETNDKLLGFTTDYYRTRIWSAPATLANYVVLGVLIGMQRMGSVLVFQLLLNVLNITLDLLFVPVLGWDITGVAVASVLSEYTALSFGMFLLRKPLYNACSAVTTAVLLKRTELVSLLALNGNIFIRTLLLVLSFFYFNATSASLSASALAANAILMQILHLCAHALDGYAHAVETLVGHAWGSKNKNNLIMSIKVSTFHSLWVAILMSGLIYFFGPQLIGLFTTQPPVIDIAVEYLPWLISLPVLSVWCYQLDGIFIGTTRSREMRNAMIVSTSIFFVSTELALPHLGNKGLWLTFCAFMVIRGLTLLHYLPTILKSVEASASATTPDSSH